MSNDQAADRTPYYREFLATLPPATAAAIGALYRAVPSFSAVEREQWDSFVEGLPYGILGNLVLHLHDRVENGHLEELPAFFLEVERLLVEGDDEIRDLVVIEVLEEFVGEAKAVPFLGPTTRRFWNGLLPSFDGVRA